MSEAKYTRGPWKTDCQSHDAPYQNIKVNSGHRNICTVWIDDAPVRDYNAEQNANARLIAAAPELLEALQGVLRVADRETIEFDAARSAIAKALGNENAN